MLFKKYFVASMGTLISMSAFAGPPDDAIIVTPQMIAEKAGIAMPWEISDRTHNGFDIENETNAPIDITIAVNQTTVPAQHLILKMLSSCCEVILRPGQTVTCSMKTVDHLQIGVMSDGPPVSEDWIFLGTYTLSKHKYNLISDSFIANPKS